MKQEKIQRLAEMIEKQQIEQLTKSGFSCECNIQNCKVTVKNGNKYIKIDIGTSGRYMIDPDGNIYGIKAYGQIHRGHYYGTIDTVDNYDWSGYRAIRKEA